jgi:hypothetical protein
MNYMHMHMVIGKQQRVDMNVKSLSGEYVRKRA